MRRGPLVPACPPLRRWGGGGASGRFGAAGLPQQPEQLPAPRPLLLALLPQATEGHLTTFSAPSQPAGLIFLKPPRLCQPGGGHRGPQRPLPSLGTAEGTDNKGLLSLGRNRTRPGPAAQPAPLRRKADPPEKGADRQAEGAPSSQTPPAAPGEHGRTLGTGTWYLETMPSRSPSAHHGGRALGCPARLLVCAQVVASLPLGLSDQSPGRRHSRTRPADTEGSPRAPAPSTHPPVRGAPPQPSPGGWAPGLPEGRAAASPGLAARRGPELTAVSRNLTNLLCAMLRA